MWLRTFIKDIFGRIDIYNHHIGEIESNLVIEVDDLKSTVDEHLVASDVLNLTRVTDISRLL